jgi:PhnB protein
MPDRPIPDQSVLDQLDRAIDALLAGSAAEAGPQELIEIARRLRNAPDESFKARLKTELQRRATMTMTATAPIREGFRTITPYISVVEGDKLIDFLKQTFGAEEIERHTHAPGAFHAEVRIGDSMLMIGSGERVRGRETPVALHVYVPDCDAAYARAIAAGATPYGSMAEPADRPYGERSGFVKDAAGNHFYIATRLSPAPAYEFAGSIFPYLYPRQARPYIEFLKQAFEAQELGVYEHEGRVMHAAVRIGDSIVEMGEAGEEYERLPTALFMYVPDVDRVYERAVAAGATSLYAPINQSYGHRDAGLKDPVGYTWYPASLL